MPVDEGSRGRHMAKEMEEQPRVLAALAHSRQEIAEAVRAVVPPRLQGIVLIARGSSDHAAVYGRYVIEPARRRPVALAAPSLHTLYQAHTDYSGWLAIAVSQSGRTPEIVTVLEAARRGGARAVAITNDPSSPLARQAEATVALGAGEERAVPATKTFTAQVAAFALIAQALGEVGWEDSHWALVPEAVQEVLNDRASARTAARRLEHANGLVAVGRGYLFPIALEAALKLKETTSILADGYSAADLRHGPIAIVERDFPVLAFSAPGPAGRDIADLCKWLRGRGARVFEVSEEGDLPLPRELPEPLVALPAAVRAQQVAHELALIRGYDPDRPEGLSKVTMTE